MRYIKDITHMITSRLFGLEIGLRSMGEEEREGESYLRERKEKIKGKGTIWVTVSGVRHKKITSYRERATCDTVASSMTGPKVG